MPEDLQALIDRLQRDAVHEGEERANAIVAEARAAAATLEREAQTEAQRRLAQAERDAAVFTERSTIALEQAGRDLLLTVRAAIGDLLGELVRTSLVEELRPNLLAEMLVKMADGYTAHGGRERRMAVLLGPADLDEMVHLYAQRYREKLIQGVELKLDPEIDHGFRVIMVDEHVEHDLTVDAIAEVLSTYLNPRLADLLPRVAVRLERGVDGSATASAHPSA